jgi:type I restriction enzyme S subunit
MTENNGQRQELPMGWTWANIDDLISTNGLFCDGDWIESKDQDSNGNVRLIQLADIGDGIFKDKSNRHLTFEKSIELGCTYLSKGDLLVARLPDPLGRACLFPLEGEKKYVTAVDICIVRPNYQDLNIHYLLYLINSPQIRTEVDKFKSGSTRKRISRKNFAKIQLSIAPTLEQHLIADKIEEFFSKLDNGIEDLEKAREQLKTYRQAVLKYAFEGKLTEEWRNVNNVYNNNYLTQLKFKINKFNKNKSGQDLTRRLPPIDLKKLKSLPFGWVWIEAHKICQSVRDGTHDTPKYVKTGMPLITSKNLKNGKIDFSNIQFISEKDHIEINKRSSVENGDILFGMIGTIGNSVIISSNNNFSIKNVGLFKKNPELILSKYLKYWLDSLTLLKILENLQLIRGTTQNFISLGSLRVLPIPYSTIEEQHAIAQEIESRLSVCDKLEQTIEDNLQKAEALRQSILKKTFAGELTRDWREKHPELITGENSAEKLLERIKAEKALSADGLKKPRSKKTKKK